MQFGLGYCWKSALWAGLLTVGLSMTLLGCHGKKPTEAAAGEHGDSAQSPAVRAAQASAVIAAVCTRQSYATASVGLIAGETGLREDVFELRDPVSYKVIPYRLGATVRLETLLRQGAEAAGRPVAEATCLRQFADHFKKLTDPLVQAAQDEKEIDSSAFNSAEREAQQELEMDEQELKQR
jgi:hypothetical protein